MGDTNGPGEIYRWANLAGETRGQRELQKEQQQHHVLEQSPRKYKFFNHILKLLGARRY